ncbi:malto-oligosyltrehalose trehalohydrolase [Luteibacter yeojuensis]|uniref:Malto-oligosyltrehalose trehalohydrolase n=1 Tax=Luteibacter yeojuensis TaxID=345309 RepID=A0A0F3KSQ9_9GAMM|nr:malto-oligosyltrehalose trehalohydrolase [Luteibacter yeojuensis]KJV33139.1 malto-oligosyltrehalose trehalohydrolase [Luteibacter yeojuensis]
MSGTFVHAMPYGARALGDGSTRFRLWAPDLDAVTLECEDGHAAAMRALDDGWFECICPRGIGSAYRFRISDDLAVPDPASRRQQAGDVHGYSVVVDAADYAWRHADWKGRPWREVVLYELHVGTLGGFKGVEAALPHLAALGITAVELMPIAEFAGERNWGYDGVLPYAPAAAYGTPDELKSLVDTAHGLGLMVFLDVVYNHFGPEGNYLHAYASGFFDGGAATPWGSAIGVSTPQVGDYFVHNALYWIEEYQFDGLRFDAVHAIGNPGWLAALAARVHAAVGPDRHVHLVLENEANQANLLGRGRFDAQWNDDFHNALHVLLTGEHEGYYAHYQQPMDKLLRSLREGFAFQGEAFAGRRRGEPSAHLPPARFVNFIQNHDQVGNRAFGDRLTTLVAPEIVEAALVLLLLAPFVPMLFMGEEWGSTTPFQFFTDFPDEALRTAVREGRRREFAAFAHFGGDDIPDPGDERTFLASIPERDVHTGDARMALVQRLIALRAKHVAPHIDAATSRRAEALGEKALVASWSLGGGTLTLYVNFGEADVAIAQPPSPAAAWLHGDAADIASLSRGLLPARRALACLES